MGVLLRTAMAVGPASAIHPEALHPGYAFRLSRRNPGFNPAPSGGIRLPPPAGAVPRGGGGGLLRYALPAGLLAGTGLALAQVQGLRNDRRLDNLVDAPMTGAY
jgi:hypothetical protein